MYVERKCLRAVWKATPTTSTGILGSTTPKELVFHVAHSTYNYYERF